MCTKIKKLILFTCLICLLAMLGWVLKPSLTLPVQAQLDPGIFDPNTRYAADEAGFDTSIYEDALPVIIGRIIKAILGFVATILLIMILYGGFLWMTAGGNKEQVGKAIDFIKNGAIGVVIVACGYVLTLTIIYIAMEGVYGWRWWP